MSLCNGRKRMERKEKIKEKQTGINFLNFFLDLKQGKPKRAEEEADNF